VQASITTEQICVEKTNVQNSKIILNHYTPNTSKCIRRSKYRKTSFITLDARSKQL